MNKIVNGLREGLWEFYLDGKIWSKINYINGMKHWKYIYYY